MTGGYTNTTFGELESGGFLKMRNGFPCGLNNEIDRGIPQMRPMNVSIDGRIVLDQIKHVEPGRDVSAYFLQPGDVIFNNTNSRELVGKTALWEGELPNPVLSNHMTYLRFDETKVDPDYIARFMQRLFSLGYFESIRRQHVNQASISLERLRDISLALPPLTEQRAIAKALRAVQDAKDATRRQLELEYERKAALMEHLFARGTQAENRIGTELGPLPQSWRVRPLEQIAKLERGKFAHRPRNAPQFYGGTTPFIQTGDIVASGGRISRYTQTLNELGVSISKIFPKGTIVITIAANIGYAGILDLDCACTDSLIAIRVNGEVNAEYLNFYLATQQSEMDRQAPRGTQKNINLEFLKPWPVVVPPMPEQIMISDCLLAHDRVLRCLHAEIEFVDEFSRGLLEELVSGRLSSAPLIAERQL